MARYKATRQLHYIDADGVDRLVQEGDYVANASDGKIAELLREGWIKEARSQGDEK